MNDQAIPTVVFLGAVSAVLLAIGLLGRAFPVDDPLERKYDLYLVLVAACGLLYSLVRLLQLML